MDKFDVALVKFDRPGPESFGDTEEKRGQFKRVAAASINRSDILVAEVHISGKSVDTCTV